MRRLGLAWAAAAALVLSAAASAVGAGPDDGTLVVAKGSAPGGVAVVTLVIKGTVVGRLTSGSPDLVDTVVIDQLDGTGQFSANPVAGTPLQTTQSTPTHVRYVGSDFRFRAVAANEYRVAIYGSGVNIVAAGKGKVTLQGMPDLSANSGRYSLNGQQFTPLPVVPTAWLQLGQAAIPHGQQPPAKATPPQPVTRGGDLPPVDQTPGLGGRATSTERFISSI